MKAWDQQELRHEFAARVVVAPQQRDELREPMGDDFDSYKQ
jgi:hypothetical protein